MRPGRWVRVKRVVSVVLAGVLAGVLVVGQARPAAAHQPFFEDGDYTAAAPGRVADPTVSTAIYATLESRGDVDYVTFEGREGQAILLGLTIPAIEGQEEFTPTLAIFGGGLPRAGVAGLPLRVVEPLGLQAAGDTGGAGNTSGAGDTGDTGDMGGAGGAGEAWGAVVLRAEPGPARVFNEPFSRTSYWERQEERVTLPADGRYTVAVWSDAGAVGRYTLVVGDREVFGGDPAFGLKLPGYWTPVEAPAGEAAGDVTDEAAGDVKDEPADDVTGDVADEAAEKPADEAAEKPAGRSHAGCGGR